ncbi:MAG TPA: hypothetical protein VFE47_19100 [Tepidisphaeraceae bacterium]|jgi:hypothetical protein|nr:hypothetical protein [Tepidisphaeraceae bacterium]
MKSPKRKLNKHRQQRKTNPAAEAKGREIIASLKELVETAEAGIPLESRFIVRTLEAPDAPAKATQKRGQLSPKAREIIASLNEAIEAEQLRIPIESRFAVRTVKASGRRSGSGRPS